MFHVKQVHKKKKKEKKETTPKEESTGAHVSTCDK